MAFRTAPGYNNLPNGQWSATIFAKEAQKAFRQETVIAGITSNDYINLAGKDGDTVKIILEPDIHVDRYARGGGIKVEDLVDSSFELVMDRANYFAFTVDDLETAFTYMDWEGMATERAGYVLTQTHDKELLADMVGFSYDLKTGDYALKTAPFNGTKAVATAGNDELLASMKLNKGSFGSITTAGAGDHSVPVGIVRQGTAQPTGYVSPTQVVARMSRLLSQQNVPREGRFLVMDPAMMEILEQEDSRFHQAEWGESGSLRNGLRLKNWLGFEVYVSNNLPQVGTGSDFAGTANQKDNYGIIVAGAKNAYAAADNLKKTEKTRIEDGFGDLIKGLHVYGGKLLRPEAIVTVPWNFA